MEVMNSTFYLGGKWVNIIVDEVIRLFDIMLQISIESRNVVVYPYYFMEDHIIHLGHGYYIQLRGYDSWSKYFMTLIILKQIRSAFHPEAGTSFCG